MRLCTPYPFCIALFLHVFLKSVSINFDTVVYCGKATNGQEKEGRIQKVKGCRTI
jgi:hypothetical protein